jgi:hypothetical protein
VNKEEAEKTLGLIRNVIQNTREDLVAHNWGLIWIVHSFSNLAACVAGWYVESRGLGLFWYLVPMAIAAVFNYVTVLLLGTRSQGVRSWVEWQIHGIWVTFIVFTACFAAVLLASNADPKLFGPVFAMTSGIGFAMMGVVFRRQLSFAFLFLAAMLAGPYLPATQWLVLGVLWWAAMMLPGIEMHREKRRRDRDAAATRIL